MQVAANGPGIGHLLASALPMELIRAARLHPLLSPSFRLDSGKTLFVALQSVRRCSSRRAEKGKRSEKAFAFLHPLSSHPFLPAARRLPPALDCDRACNKRTAVETLPEQAGALGSCQWSSRFFHMAPCGACLPQKALLAFAINRSPPPRFRPIEVCRGAFCL